MDTLGTVAESAANHVLPFLLTLYGIYLIYATIVDKEEGPNLVANIGWIIYYLPGFIAFKPLRKFVKVQAVVVAIRLVGLGVMLTPRLTSLVKNHGDLEGSDEGLIITI